MLFRSPSRFPPRTPGIRRRNAARRHARVSPDDKSRTGQKTGYQPYNCSHSRILVQTHFRGRHDRPPEYRVRPRPDTTIPTQSRKRKREIRYKIRKIDGMTNGKVYAKKDKRRFADKTERGFPPLASQSHVRKPVRRVFLTAIREPDRGKRFRKNNSGEDVRPDILSAIVQLLTGFPARAPARRANGLRISAGK